MIDRTVLGLEQASRRGDGRADISKAVEMYATIISMADETTSRALKALSDPTRLHIVEFVSRCCCGRVAVLDDGGVIGPTAGEVCCHITGAQKITSTVSHHLHELEDAGLVKLERRGKTTVCTLLPTALLDLSHRLAELAKGEFNGECC